MLAWGVEFRPTQMVLKIATLLENPHQYNIDHGCVREVFDIHQNQEKQKALWVTLPNRLICNVGGLDDLIKK